MIRKVQQGWWQESDAVQGNTPALCCFIYNGTEDVMYVMCVLSDLFDGDNDVYTYNSIKGLSLGVFNDIQAVYNPPTWSVFTIPPNQ